MEFLVTARAVLAGVGGWLEALEGSLGSAWGNMNSGFAGIIILGLAAGVVTFTRRRRDLFRGVSVGWVFAAALGLTGLLMATGPVAPEPAGTWLRGSQVLVAPLALALMVVFLLRVLALEASDELDMQEAALRSEADQARRRLEVAREENAELTAERDRALNDARRLAQERDAASREASEARIGDGHTGLYTRAHFVERLKEEFERYHRQGSLPLPLFIGLQGLEEADETHREAVIARAGHIVREELRLPDLACRFGALELLVVPCDADDKGATALARRLHGKLKRALTRFGPPRPAVAFVLMDFPVPLQQFDDFLEACERGSVRVQAQPENRLVHLPATFETR